MTVQSIINDINAGKLKSIYFLTGEEPYYIDYLTDYIENNFLSESEKVFNQTVLYGKDIDASRVIDELMQYPMMASHRLVIVKEAQEIKNFNNLESYILKPVHHSILVLNYKNKKLDKRTKIAKALQDCACVFETKKLYENQIPDWIIEQGKLKGLEIDPNAARLMTEFVGADLSKLSNEISKLALSNTGTINVDVVREQIGISREFNIFELQKALAFKDRLKATLIAKYLGENPKSNPIQVSLANLFNFFMKVMMAVQYHRLPDSELAKVMGLGNTFFVQEYRTAAKNYSLTKLKEIINLISDFDLMSKGVSNRSISDDQLIKELVYFILK